MPSSIQCHQCHTRHLAALTQRDQSWSTRRGPSPVPVRQLPNLGQLRDTTRQIGQRCHRRLNTGLSTLPKIIHIRPPRWILLQQPQPRPSSPASRPRRSAGSKVSRTTARDYPPTTANLTTQRRNAARRSTHDMWWAKASASTWRDDQPSPPAAQCSTSARGPQGKTGSPRLLPSNSPPSST